MPGIKRRNQQKTQNPIFRRTQIRQAQQQDALLPRLQEILRLGRQLAQHNLHPQVSITRKRADQEEREKILFNLGNKICIYYHFLNKFKFYEEHDVRLTRRRSCTLCTRVGFIRRDDLLVSKGQARGGVYLQLSDSRDHHQDQHIQYYECREGVDFLELRVSDYFLQRCRIIRQI